MKRFLIMLPAVLMIMIEPLAACTNFLVSRGASKSGSTFITYAADSHTLYGELYFWAAANHAPGTMMNVYEWDTGVLLGEIAQAEKTWRVVGNMNEHALAIGETTFGGVEKLIDTTGIIDYGSLIYITLQRAKTAREAIKIMTELVAEYGYRSGGESFSIADPDEVWILEMVGKGTALNLNKKTKRLENASKGAVWVAVRIPDGYVSAHANQARIQTFRWSDGKTSISSGEMNRIFDPAVEVVYARDVAQTARDFGLYSGSDSDFSFSDTYNPLDFGGARFCEARVWSFFRSVNGDMDKYADYAAGKNLKNRMPLCIKPDAPLSFEHVAAMMRDHYEGTDLDMTNDIGAGPFRLPYRWRPMTWSIDGEKLLHERAIATQQTGFWFVAEGRSSMPRTLGGILWFGTDDAATSCLTPIYGCSLRTPEEYAAGNGDLLTYSDNAAFWVFSRVTNFAYLRYEDMSRDIIKVQRELETKYREMIPLIDEHARKLHSENRDKALEFVTDFSVNTAAATVKRWKELDRYLLVKYIDGNVKKEADGKFKRTSTGIPAAPNQPQLPEFWRRAIKNDTGEKLKQIEN
ncbi:MAG: C69 family dipeptidase [Prevotellaceae bacterium]|jgi:dipeptidase|nr:C69 family dipeptidase [Prevotellaceae bacterium]